MVQIKNANQEAFKQLYERYSHKVFNYLHRKSDRQLAEDLAQTTFVKVFERASTYKSEYPVSAWIYTIAKNLLMDTYRKRQRGYTHLERLKNLFIDDHAAELEKMWRDLLIDLKLLDDKNREIILMRYKEGLEFDEIAKKLDTSVVNARKLLSRANQSLKVLLETESE